MLRDRRNSLRTDVDNDCRNCNKVDFPRNSMKAFSLLSFWVAKAVQDLGNVSVHFTIHSNLRWESRKRKSAKEMGTGDTASVSHTHACGHFLFRVVSPMCPTHKAAALSLRWAQKLVPYSAMIMGTWRCHLITAHASRTLCVYVCGSS